MKPVNEQEGSIRQSTENDLVSAFIDSNYGGLLSNGVPEKEESNQLCKLGSIYRSLFLQQLRWLDWIFWRGYLPSLSINYVAMSKDREKRLPQLYYIKMKTSFDLGFIAIGVAMAT